MGAATTLLTGIPNSNPILLPGQYFLNKSVISAANVTWPGPQTPIYTSLKQCDSDPFYGFPFSLIMVLKRPRLPARR
ncbi:hypothetical protein VNO77_43722 [Canavalia gladiata]|uniref:Uncharacterized protein n=1 Tax=Canavalia gladiata TaxID=3824 RepID=A0AAN9PN57_CANGL